MFLRILDRLTSFFLVQQEERGQTAYFLLIFLLLGAGLAIGRGSADALFFKRFGIEYLPLMFVFFGLLLAVFSTAYAAYADRIPSEKFYVYILILLVLMLSAAWLMMYMQVTDLVYPAYFLVFEVSSEILMMHALFYTSQNFETRQAKRLTPLIFAAAQLGRITGGLVLSLTSGFLGVQNMVPLWILLCGASVVLIVRRHRYIGVSPYYRSSRKGRNGFKHSLEQINQGLRFAKQSDLLKAASFALFFLVVSYYIASYSVNRIYTETFRTEESLSIFFGMLTATTAGAALLIQLFVTGRLLQRFGIKKVNLVFPVTSVLSYLLLAISFTLPAALVASFNKDSLMTAIRNPTRNLLFNALPDYMQGRGRSLLMALVLPVAVITTGGFLHGVRLIENAEVFLATGLVASAVYLYFSVRINRAYVRTILDTLKERVFLPENQQNNLLRNGGGALLAELIKGIGHDDPEIVVSHATLLVRGYPDKCMPVILDRIKRADAVLGNRLLKIVRHLDLSAHRDALRTCLVDADDQFRATVYSLLFSCREPEAENEVVSFLNSPDAEIQAIGAYGVFQYDRKDLYDKADGVLAHLLRHPNPVVVRAGLNLLRSAPVKEQHSILTNTLDHADVEIQKSALAAVYRWSGQPGKEWRVKIQALCDSADPGVRIACTRALSRYNEDEAAGILFGLLEDRHPGVRSEAVKSLKTVLPNHSAALMEWVLGNSGSPRAQQSVLDAMDRGTIGVDLFVKVARSRLEDALRCRDLLQTMDKSNGYRTPAEELLMHVLRERIQQYTNVILGVMAFLEDPVTLGVIRAGLQSGDPRQIANACEALSELKHLDLANGLEVLYGARHGKTARNGQWFLHPADGLRWVAGNLDPWMRKVAARALAAG